MKRYIWMMAALAVWSTAAAQDYNTLVERAMDLTQKDSLVQAEQLYRQALKIEPNNARNALVFSNLGTVLKRQGKTDEAIESYTLALNIIPYSTAMLLNRAALYMEKGLTEKAYVDYCSVIDLLPNEKEARLVRAYIYLTRRQYKEARIDYNVILTADVKHKAARIGLAMLDQKEGKYVAATDALNQLIAEYPGDASLLHMRANVALDQGYAEAALTDLEEAVRIDPSDAETYVLMGDICLERKKKKEAKAAYMQAIEKGFPRAALTGRLKECK